MAGVGAGSGSGNGGGGGGSGGGGADGDAGAAPAKRARAPRPYLPKHRTAAYAILRAMGGALLAAGSGGGGGPRDAMTKDEIVTAAAQHCDASFDDPSADMPYKAWSAMKYVAICCECAAFLWPFLLCR